MEAENDFSSGLPAQCDYALPQAHSNPLVYETFNTFIYDGERNIGLNPNLIHVRGGEARERSAILLGDGRQYFSMSTGRYTDPRAPGDDTYVYRCLEPFKRWRYSWNGMAELASFQDQSQGHVSHGGEQARVSVELVAEAVSEAWVMPLSTGPAFQLGEPEFEGDSYLGKYEQLLRADGRVSVNDESWEFSGSGVRGHVRGARDTAGMAFHSWICGIFPSGRGFNLKQLHDEAGNPYFSQAYLLDGHKAVRAKILQTPDLVRVPQQPEYEVVLQTPAETARIRGFNKLTSWVPIGEWGGIFKTPDHAAYGIFGNGYGLVQEARMIMSQGFARFEWDGEEGYGMCELSG